MKLENLLKILEERDLRIEVDAEGQPHIRGDKSAVTPALLSVLKFHREALIEQFRPVEYRAVLLSAESWKHERVLGPLPKYKLDWGFAIWDLAASEDPYKPIGIEQRGGGVSEWKQIAIWWTPRSEQVQRNSAKA